MIIRSHAAMRQAMSATRDTPQRAALRMVLWATALAIVGLVGVLLRSNSQSALAERPDSVVEKFGMLHGQIQSLFESASANTGFFVHWASVTIGKSGQESGNRGRDWNVGQNFGGGETNFFALLPVTACHCH